jgi:hypothetical protein
MDSYDANSLNTILLGFYDLHFQWGLCLEEISGTESDPHETWGEMIQYPCHTFVSILPFGLIMRSKLFLCERKGKSPGAWLYRLAAPVVPSAHSHIIKWLPPRWLANLAGVFLEAVDRSIIWPHLTCSCSRSAPKNSLILKNLYFLPSLFSKKMFPHTACTSLILHLIICNNHLRYSQVQRLQFLQIIPSLW